MANPQKISSSSLILFIIFKYNNHPSPKIIINIKKNQKQNGLQQHQTKITTPTPSNPNPKAINQYQHCP
jgi:hypothetical protein